MTICRPCIFKNHTECDYYIAGQPINDHVTAEVCECPCTPYPVQELRIYYD